MKCLNWKVLAARAAVGEGVYALAPNMAAAAAPLLALCPLPAVDAADGAGHKVGVDPWL